MIPSNSNALLEEFDEIGSELYPPPSNPPTVMHFAIFVFFYWLFSFIIIKNFSIVSANWFQKLFKEKLRLIEMRQRNQDNFTIHIRMVYSHPKLITDLNLTISLLVSQVWYIDQTFFLKNLNILPIGYVNQTDFLLHCAAARPPPRKPKKN